MSLSEPSSVTLRCLPLTHDEAVLLHHALYMAYGNRDLGFRTAPTLALWDKLRETLGRTWSSVVVDSARLERLADLVITEPPGDLPEPTGRWLR